MTATDQNIFDQTASVIRAHFRVDDRTHIGPETSSEDLPGWDSLSHTLLILAVEERFGIELPPDRTFDLENVGALVALIGQTLP